MGRIGSAPSEHDHLHHRDEACSELSSITEHRSWVSSSGQAATQQSPPVETFQNECAAEPQDHPPLPTEVLLPREKVAVLGISTTDYHEARPHCFVHGVLLPPWMRRSPAWLQCLVLGCLFIFLAAALIIFASVAWQIRGTDEASSSSSSSAQQEDPQAWRNNNVVVAPTPVPTTSLQLPAEASLVPTAFPSALPSSGPSPGPSDIPSLVHSDTPSESPSLLPSGQPTSSFSDVPSVSLEPSLEPSFSTSPSDDPSLSLAPSHSYQPTSASTQFGQSSGMPSLEPTQHFGQQQTTSTPSMLPSLTPSLPPFRVTPTPTNNPTSAPSIIQRAMTGGGMGMMDSSSTSDDGPRLTAFPTFSPRGVNTR